MAEPADVEMLMRVIRQKNRYIVELEGERDRLVRSVLEWWDEREDGQSPTPEFVRLATSLDNARRNAEATVTEAT